MIKILNIILKKFGYIAIPQKPPQALLGSMALRYDHSFGLSASMTDEEIKEIKEKFPIIGKQYLTSREREVILGQMSQLHEEVVGRGFYKY